MSFDPFTCGYVEVSARDGDTCDIGDSKCANAPCPNNMICHCSDPAVSDVPINEISGDLSSIHAYVPGCVAQCAIEMGENCDMNVDGSLFELVLTSKGNYLCDYSEPVLV